MGSVWRFGATPARSSGWDRRPEDRSVTAYPETTVGKEAETFMLITAPHLVELSSAADDDASLGAAGAVLSAGDPGAELDRLYPALLHHKTLLAAISHLERAGGDLKELSVSSALYRSLWPLNVLMPIPDPSAPGRISLASIREQLDRHRLLLRGVVRDLVDLGPSFRFLLIFGRSLEAAYPQYKLRMDYDTDLFAPH